MPADTDMLKQKHLLLTRVYELTRNAKIGNSADDAEKYIELIDKRENIFNQIRSIDDKMGNDTNGKPFILDESLKLLKDIFDLSKKMESSVGSIVSDLKQRMQGIGNGRIINNAYQQEYVNSYDQGFMFDTKQ